MDRDTILNGGNPAWWFVRDVTKAHLVVDVNPAVSHVFSRCGFVIRVSNLERRLDPTATDYVDPEPRCKGCSQRGAIR